MTPEQRDVLRHALGLNRKDKPYRNFYAAEPDDKICNELVDKLAMTRGREIPGGLVYFYVTNFGRELANRDADEKSAIY